MYVFARVVSSEPVINTMQTRFPWSLPSGFRSTSQKDLKLSQCQDSNAMTTPNMFGEVALPSSHIRTYCIFSAFYRKFCKIANLLMTSTLIMVEISMLISCISSCNLQTRLVIFRAFLIYTNKISFIPFIPSCFKRQMPITIENYRNTNLLPMSFDRCKKFKVLFYMVLPIWSP